MTTGLFADFEDWRMGTFGWTMRGAPDPRDGDFDDGYGSGNGENEARIMAPRGGHFDPRNFSSLGPRVPVEVSAAVCPWCNLFVRKQNTGKNKRRVNRLP